ncbi:MAG TPA: hypothetical protein VHT28_18125 [Silvibacterium sp.]|jgi:hypothetical protein|nr:hypothetical protein [Silvibacterium sp.]
MSDETKSSNAWLSVGGAFVFVVLAIGAYVYFNTRPPVHAGEVLSVDTYPIHRDLSTGPNRGSTTEGIAGQADTYDELLVLTNVRIKNQTDIPLFLHDMWAVADLPDGDQRSLAATQTDFAKVFVAYPDLKLLRKDPLPRDITLQPGQQVEGMMIFNYPISKAQWDSRSGLDITMTFQHQKPLLLHVDKQ